MREYKKTALVLGAGGFIGSHMVKRLREEGYWVRGVDLKYPEFLIVKELAKRPGIIKERAQLMDIAYREDTDIEDRTIDSHVKRIRKKFKKVDPDFSAIETRYGSGYRWNVS